MIYFMYKLKKNKCLEIFNILKFLFLSLFFYPNSTNTPPIGKFDDSIPVTHFLGLQVPVFLLQTNLMMVY